MSPAHVEFISNSFADQTEIPVSVVLHPPLPPTNLYFMSIMRIHEVKHGPFHEHSSQLYSIAAGVASWAKVNSGLFKMYEVRSELTDCFLIPVIFPTFIVLASIQMRLPAECIPTRCLLTQNFFNITGGSSRQASCSPTYPSWWST